jgi:cobalt-zinc-cadmium efflux system outer membrane protein
MRTRSADAILFPIAILAAALVGCQTAGTSSDSSKLRVGTTLTDSNPASHSDPSLPALDKAPRIALVLDASDRPKAAGSADDEGGQTRPVADFAAATTVPPSPSSVEQWTGAASSSNTAAARSETPIVADAPSMPGGLGAAADPGAVQMTLDAAIATSLDRNETLVTLRAGEPVAAAMLEVAKRYPWNPYIKAEVLPYARDPMGNLLAVRNTVYILQALELAHQQTYREESAAAALNQVRWNVVAAELTNLATTERLFFTALYQRDLRDLARRAAALNEELAADVERRYKSGLSKPGEEVTARVSLRQSRKQAALAEATYRLALLTLLRQLNVTNDRPVELVGRLEDFGWSSLDGIGSVAGAAPGALDQSHVVETLADERPDVRAAQAGVNVAQANAELARANTVQNIQFGPYYERDEFETLFFGFAAQMTLPIWDSGKPLAHQREAECTQRTVGFNALRMRARVEVQTALERYGRARALAEKERASLGQSSSEDLPRIKRQFEAGQADILNVFATQTALLQEQKAYLDLLNELAQSAADVTLAAALPPARIISGHEPEVPAAPAPPAAPSAK